jgi:hypothetical protein
LIQDATGERKRSARLDRSQVPRKRSYISRELRQLVGPFSEQVANENTSASDLEQAHSADEVTIELVFIHLAEP